MIHSKFLYGIKLLLLRTFFLSLSLVYVCVCVHREQPIRIKWCEMAVFYLLNPAGNENKLLVEGGWRKGGKYRVRM